jgi:hypothetical protein
LCAALSSTIVPKEGQRFKAVADEEFSAIPVVPNASLVRGRLLSVKPWPGGPGTEWAIVVDGAQDVAGLPNFVRDYVGKTINVRVRSEIKPPVPEHHSLEARIAYRGDERGGLFTLVGNEAREV